MACSLQLKVRRAMQNTSKNWGENNETKSETAAEIKVHLGYTSLSYIISGGGHIYHQYRQGEPHR